MKTGIKTLKMRTQENGITGGRHTGILADADVDGRIVTTSHMNQCDLFQPNTDYICAMIPVPEGWEQIPSGAARGRTGLRYWDRGGWYSLGDNPAAGSVGIVYIAPKQNDKVVEATRAVEEAEARCAEARKLLKEIKNAS